MEVGAAGEKDAEASASFSRFNYYGVRTICNSTVIVDIIL